MAKIANIFMKMRVFFFECVSPLDKLNGRCEIDSLNQICKQIGHESAVFPVLNKTDFLNACNYVSSIQNFVDDSKQKPICIHLSAHGHKEDGLSFGTEDIGWDELFSFLRPICEMKYNGDRVFILSACHAIEQQFTRVAEKISKRNKSIVFPKYIFFPGGDSINWDDAIVGWTIFYHQLPKLSLSEKEGIKVLLKNIKELGVGNFQYRRWDDVKNKYIKFTN